MTPSLKGLLGCTLMSVVAFSLIGRVAGGPVNTAQNCPAPPVNWNCGETGDFTCKIDLVVKGNSVVAHSREDSTSDEVRVGPDRTIRWYDADTSTDGFVVHFKDDNHPFPAGKNTFGGGASSNAGSTPVRFCKDKICCYDYTAILFRNDGTFIQSDPRIIVGSGSGGGKKHKKKR